MAGKTTAKATEDNSVLEDKTSDQKKKNKIDIENLNLDEKVTVVNLAGWPVHFARINDIGDVTITPNGKQRLSRNEIQSQVNVNNILFTGTDGRGTHATVYIDDEATRYYVGFENEDSKQEIFTDELAKELFGLSFEKFQERLPKAILTRAEKYALSEAVKRLGINDYKKIVLTEKYTGYKIGI